jgi:hypothetical protein
MTDQKPIKKGKIRAHKLTSRQFHKNSSMNINASEGGHSFGQHSETPDVQFYNTSNQNALQSLSSIKKGSFNDAFSIANQSPDLSSHNLNNSQSNSKFQSMDSTSNLIPIDASRKLSGLLRKKSRLIRNANLLSPRLNLSKRNSFVVNGSLTRKQVSTMNEIEAEIDSLLT